VGFVGVCGFVFGKGVALLGHFSWLFVGALSELGFFGCTWVLLVILPV
jgi:hypothetical protein